MFTALALFVILAIGGVLASANSLTLSFNPANTFSGTAPAGSLSATFTDVMAGSDGCVFSCVQLTIGSNLGTGENLDPAKALYLNINPSLDSH